jgi:hypothetical protein
VYASIIIFRDKIFSGDKLRQFEQTSTVSERFSSSVRCQVLTVVSMKITVFWVVAPCSLVDRPDDGGSNHLGNVGKLLPDYTAQHRRRQSSSFSLPPSTMYNGIILVAGQLQVLFLNGLFNDAANSSDYIASNNRISNEQ